LQAKKCCRLANVIETAKRAEGGKAPHHAHIPTNQPTPTDQNTMADAADSSVVADAAVAAAADEQEQMEEQEQVITAELLESKIQASIEGVEFVKAVDESDGCGSKFTIEIVSPMFKGKPLLAQHRIVHKAIEEERKSIHALTLKTKASV
jgi:stress-induced morphogen